MYILCATPSLEPIRSLVDSTASLAPGGRQLLYCVTGCHRALLFRGASLCHSELLNTIVANAIIPIVRQSIPRKFPLIRLATTIAQHCEDNVLMGIPPAPNTSRFISAGELAALGSNSSLADALESILRDEIRGKYEPYLKAKLGDAVARNWCMQLETQLIRLAFGKSLHPNYPGGVAGKFSKDKAVTLAKNWLIAIEKENECMDGSIYHFGFAEEGMEEESEVTKSIHTEQVQSV